MRLHETFADFADIVRSYEIIQYDAEGLSSRLKIRVVLADGSLLDGRETILGGQVRKYAYHWRGLRRGFRARRDNAAHWPHVSTHPHHKHIDREERVVDSDATTLTEVLSVIRDLLTRRA